ncbi:MAG: hypothetical protein GEV07_30565 [Streptosporangiales bacterium]|nr:hypothetical protein [Streptosporangiales bacterium]
MRYGFVMPYPDIRAVPKLAAEAAAFAAHYGFTIDPLAAYRPMAKGRVERQVLIVREHVLVGRYFDSLVDLDDAFTGWLRIRHTQVHRTHGEVIGIRAETDRAALRRLPERPYLVAESHLRRVSKDCLVSFAASMYSVPARRIRAGQRVELRVSPEAVAIHALTADTATDAAEASLLAVHPRAARRGSWVVDDTHWAGLPDGHIRATVVEPPRRGTELLTDLADQAADREPNPLAALLVRHHAAGTAVAHRGLDIYQTAATTTNTTAEETR